MEPPVLPSPPGLWKTTERPYFMNKFAPINKNHRDIPWSVATEVVDSKGNHAILEEEGLELRELIGTGTYSTVHRGYWKAYRQHVAVKIYEKARGTLSAQAVPALKKVTAEVEALKCLKHPNIVSFFGAMETMHRVYLILEVVEKGNLLQYIKSNGGQGDSNLSRKWFGQLTSAVTHCHRKEIAHRDIKCENILLDTELNIRLSDFGFAVPNITWFEDVHNDVFLKMDEYCGSLAYMSPELVKRKSYCPLLSDVWAMGIVLYGIIYAKFPYEEVTEENIADLAGKFTAPETPKVSPQVEEIFRKIFQIEAKRIRSHELLDKRWLEYEAESLFLGQLGYLSKNPCETKLTYKKQSMPRSVREKLVIDN